MKATRKHTQENTGRDALFESVSFWAFIFAFSAGGVVAIEWAFWYVFF